MNLSDKISSALGDGVELRAVEDQYSALGPTPEAVAAPRDEASARELILLCARDGHPLVVRGGGTKWHSGAKPAKVDLVLLTHHLNTVWDHDEGNATLEAGAGLTLAAANAVIGTQRQFVPIDEPDTATLGGIVATGASGSWRQKYGAPRDLVTGLRAVLSDGRVIHGGAKVVKNVAGYDLPKLFIGSHGTLGLLTRVILRLRPNDVATATWSADFPNWKALEAGAWEILDGPFEPTSLRATVTPTAFHLRARFDGGEGAVHAQLTRLPPGYDEAPVVTEAVLWSLRTAVPLREAPAIGRAALEAGAHTVEWDCGLGILSAHFGEDFKAEQVKQLRGVVERTGGYLIVERAPLDHRTAAVVWGDARPDVGLMKGLKAAYDAKGIFAPGRFVGGV